MAELRIVETEPIDAAGVPVVGHPCPKPGGLRAGRAGGGEPRLIRPEDDGTPEASWRPWIAGLPVGSMDLAEIVVVAPHPDDETLGAGGLLAAAARADGAVRVIVCSDGEAAYPVRALAATRRGELDGAMACLAGGAPIDIVRLALPDGDLAGHREEVRAALTAHAGPDATVVAPWWGDGHPDHEAVGEVCRQLVGRVRRVLFYPVWAWHWSGPAAFGNTAMIRVPLDDGLRAVKRQAIACYRSQIAGTFGPAILTDSALAHFDRGDEVFVVGS